MSEPKIPFDQRVDQIGDASELQKQFVDELKTKLKLRMLDQDADRVTGERFEGLLVTGTRVGTIDAKKFEQLCEQKGIPAAKRLACLKVSNDAASEILSGAEIEKISTFKEPSPSLRISKITTVEIKLVDALKRLNAAIRGRDKKPLRVS